MNADTPWRIFVYCDDPSHQKIVAVTNFQQEPGSWHDGRDGWSEAYPSRNNHQSLGTTIKDDDTPYSVSQDGLQPEGPLRSRYRLACRKCRQRPVVAREERLFTALDWLAAARESRISLSGLAASIEALSRSGEFGRDDSPETGQG